MNNASLSNHLKMIADCLARIYYLEIALDILTSAIIRHFGDDFSLEDVKELKVAMAWLSKYQGNAIGSPRTNYSESKRVLSRKRKKIAPIEDNEVL
jgi:hypothetical protein